MGNHQGGKKKLSGVQNGPFILCWSCQRVTKPKSIIAVYEIDGSAGTASVLLPSDDVTTAAAKVLDFIGFFTRVIWIWISPTDLSYSA